MFRHFVHVIAKMFRHFVHVIAKTITSPQNERMDQYSTNQPGHNYNSTCKNLARF
jgi:hypothetical protein